jgi:transposase
MPVCLALLLNAACPSKGCLCRDRQRSYPPDLSDEEWAVLELQAREIMRELIRAPGRPMDHDLRAMCDAVAYVVRNGIEWRAVRSTSRHGVRFTSSTCGGTGGACRRRW